MPPSPTSNPKDIRGLVDRVCEEMGLSPFTANTVEQWVLDGPDAWASCCLGGCDPCNDVLRAAARKVLATLEEADSPR